MSDDIKALWQKQETEYAPMPLEEIRNKAGKFHSTIRWRNIREYAAMAFLVCVFGFYIWLFPAPLMRLGSALIIAAMFFVGWQLHKRGTTDKLPADDSGSAWTDYYRRELARQRDALQSIWKWYLGPMVPGLVVFLVGASLKMPPAAQKQAWIAGTVALCIAVFGGAWALNAWTARRLQRKIDGLGW
jgi:Flp pilus assembly protein TadB